MKKLILVAIFALLLISPVLADEVTPTRTTKDLRREIRNDRMELTKDRKEIMKEKVKDKMKKKKHKGAFIGEVTSKGSDSLVIKTINRGTLTVFTTSSTKFVGRNETTITFSDIQVGHRIRVKGLWDKSLNKITEVTQVKDFTLPVKPTKAPKTP